MSSKRTARLLIVTALGTIATVGLWEGSRGVLLPSFLSDLHLSAALGGTVFSATAIGYLASSLSFGALSQRVGLKKMVVAAMLLLATAMTLFVTLRLPSLLYVVNVFLGASISIIELSTSIQVSLIYQEKQSGMLNLLHGCFGAGALLGSQWAAFWLGLGAAWRVPFGLVAVFLILWCGSFLPQPVLPVPKEEPGAGGGFGPVLRDPLVWVAALALGAAVVGEVGFTLWFPTFLQRVKGMAPGPSAGYATAFFVGFTATRLAGSWLVGRLGQIRTVFGLALVGLAALSAILLLEATPILLPALAGAGVATGFATCTALVAERYPERVNRVYTIMYSSGGLAGILTGPLMGWLGDRYGLTASMWVPLISLGLLAALMAYYGLAGGARRAASEKMG